MDRDKAILLLLGGGTGVRKWNELHNHHICIDANLSGADLSGANLTGVDLRGANLRGAQRC